MKKILFIIVSLLLIGTIFTGCIENQTPPETQEKTHEEIAKEFMTTLSNKNYQEAYTYFAQILIDSFSLEQLLETWEYFIQTYGEYDEIIETRQTNTTEFEIIYFNITFQNDYLLTFKIVFDEDKKISGFWLENIESLTEYNPPSYVNPENFTETNVSIGSGQWILPATLTIPNITQLHQVVILVHGSGPNDQDETIGPNKPFKDLAWGLATNGIAVLRYDKRTKIYPEELALDKNLTVKEEVIDDAIEAVKILQNQSSIDQYQIYILGHSLGAMMAPKIAELEPDIKGIIFLAAPARSLEDLLIQQIEYLADLDGTRDETEIETIQITKEEVQKIKTLNITDDEKALTVYRAYWEYLADYDQVKTAENLTKPILILQGKRDYQVTYEDDFYIWNNTIGNNVNVDLITYETLNHLFIHGTGTPSNEEYMLPGHVQEDVIKNITDWIKLKRI
jgi:esterase/lipase